MPVYICNSVKGAIGESAKPKIAEDITRIHCEVTGAPAIFVHVFFFDEAPFLPLNGKTAVFQGRIRQGRDDATKAVIMERITQSISQHAGLTATAVASSITDTPASWVMEGGDLFPEPGQEAAWLVAHEAKLAAKSLR
jgi:phenylpyruvate tautomerase PptA (4-oxalocrotonate tautomerase family)